MGLEIALVVLGLRLIFLIAVGLACFATDVLTVTWHPVAIVASVATYVVAVLVGLASFSVLALALSAI